jgi:hypothetical protein
MEHQEVRMVNGHPLDKLREGSGWTVKGQGLNDLLTQVGEDGWEMISHLMPNIGTEVFVFKRSKT